MAAPWSIMDSVATVLPSGSTSRRAVQPSTTIRMDCV